MLTDLRGGARLFEEKGHIHNDSPNEYDIVLHIVLFSCGQSTNVDH